MKIREKAFRLLLWGLFLGYLAVLAYLLFFSSAYGRTMEAGYRYNLTPMLEIMRALQNVERVGYRYVILNLGGNIVAFMPFGYFVTALSERKQSLVGIALESVLFSLTVETIQYLTRTGAFDVDDLLLNTVGGICGYLWYQRRAGGRREKKKG